MFVWHQLLDKPRSVLPTDGQHGSFLGPKYDASYVQNFLAKAGIQGTRFDDEAGLFDQVAGLLNEEKVVGWFQGRMEFGPRSLGARSILGDPRSPRMQATMNVKIKFRESFRPFAPCVLAERASEWFAIDPKHESPYMLLVAPVREEHRLPIDEATARLMETDPDLLRRVRICVISFREYCGFSRKNCLAFDRASLKHFFQSPS